MFFINDEEYLDCKIINSTFADNQYGLYVNTMGPPWYGSSDVFLTNSIFYNSNDFNFSGFDDETASAIEDLLPSEESARP